MRKTEKKNSLFSMLLVASLSFLLYHSLLLIQYSPLGIKLEELNDEKEYLLEENRVISEEIAKNSSLKVIEDLS